MIKRIALATVFFVATPAAAQVIDCTKLGNTTTCRQQSDGQPQLDRAQGALIDSTRPIAAPVQMQQPQVVSSTPESRRAEAYAQVGKMIADGDCPGAVRLAQFYGKPDIIADTAEACKR